MGYTHYWKQAKAATPEQWQDYIEAVRLVLDASAVRLAYEYDQPNAAPQVDTRGVRFNGTGDNGHETFLVQSYAQDFSFCKTAAKPYDECVVACLILATKYLPGFTWSSDGDKRDHRDGLALAQRVDDSITATGCDEG